VTDTRDRNSADASCSEARPVTADSRRKGLLSALGAVIERNWYRSALANIWLLPLWLIVAPVVYLKRLKFRLQPPKPASVPVLVVGNITVGGTGKTPLILLLIERARVLGLKPAVISRGYGSRNEQWPLTVTSALQADECGDEPKLIHARSGVPVVVDPQRARAAAAVPAHTDIIFSDDGLQHYALARAAELVVMDGQRRLGNGWLLPVGPLREPASRLKSVDMVLENGSSFRVEPIALVNALSGESRPLDYFAGTAVWAVSGIGNPQRFYASLAQIGAETKPVSFPDHHDFSPADFDFTQGSSYPVVMTEKDWVKCRAFAQPDWWYLQVDAVPQPDIQDRLDALLLATAQRKG